MNIVININDCEYEKIKEDAEKFRSKEMVVPYLYKVIESGTQLPKGHGRLIDADAIKPIKAPIAPLTPDDAVHYEWVYIKSRIDQTPTIIEADKEGEQE